jgi:hypothetical protein
MVAASTTAVSAGAPLRGVMRTTLTGEIRLLDPQKIAVGHVVCAIPPKLALHAGRFVIGDPVRVSCLGGKLQSVKYAPELATNQTSRPGTGNAPTSVNHPSADLRARLRQVGGLFDRHDLPPRRADGRPEQRRRHDLGHLGWQHHRRRPHLLVPALDGCSNEPGGEGRRQRRPHLHRRRLRLDEVRRLRFALAQRRIRIVRHPPASGGANRPLRREPCGSEDGSRGRARRAPLP